MTFPLIACILITVSNNRGLVHGGAGLEDISRRKVSAVTINDKEKKEMNNDTTTATITLPVTFPEFTKLFGELKKEGVTTIRITHTDYTICTHHQLSRSGIARYSITNTKDFSSVPRTLSAAFSFLREKLNEHVINNKTFQTFIDALEGKTYNAGMNEVTFYDHLKGLSPEDIIRLALIMRKNLAGFQWSLYGKFFREVTLAKKGDTLTLHIFGKAHAIPEDVTELAEKLMENK